MKRIAKPLVAGLVLVMVVLAPACRTTKKQNHKDQKTETTATANWLRSNAGYNLLIEGHCDERGTEQYNLALGDRRANTAKEYLMTLGIDAGRIRTVSYGEERPFDEGHDDAAWAKNRRAHLVLVR